MEWNKLAQLSKAPKFGTRTTRACKVCGHDAAAFDVVDFYKTCHPDPHLFGLSGIAVPYYRCVACEFLFTDFCDDWTAEDFAGWVYNDRYVLADPEYLGARSRRMGLELAPTLGGFKDARILDYGSGHGHFTAVLNEHGFRHTESYDPFTSPQRPAGKFDLITCMEVIEHSAGPLALFDDLMQLLNPGGAVLLSQCVQPPDISRIRGAWWYLGPRNGHISTYSRYTLQVICGRHQRSIHERDQLYLVTDQQPNAAVAALAACFEQINAIRLLAPDGSSCHGTEGSDFGPFRWTAQEVVTWPDLHFPAGKTTIAIPYVAEVAPGFAAGSSIWVGERAFPVSCEHLEINATVTLNSAVVSDIELRQPALLPSRGDNDPRRLGIAIRV